MSIWFSGPKVEYFKTKYHHMGFKLVQKLEYCTSAPFSTLSLFCISWYNVILDIQICLTKLICFHCKGYWDGCVIEQYKFKTINVLIIHPWILVAKWATRFWFLVVHRQHLVALARGQAVICNPAGAVLLSGRLHAERPFKAILPITLMFPIALKLNYLNCQRTWKKWWQLFYNQPSTLVSLV